MAASCNVRTNTINKFRELKLLYENSMRITSRTEFNYYNQYYTGLAKETYNIDMNELMFYIESEEKQKSSIQPLPYYRVADMEMIHRAIVNENFFDILQERFYDQKNIDELVDIEYSKSLRDKLAYTGPFNKIELEKLTDDPDISELNEEKEKKRITEVLSKNKNIVKSFFSVMTSLGERGIPIEDAELYIRDLYYEYVRNFPENQSSESFNKFVIKDIIERRKRNSKSLKVTNSVKTNTSFPDINLEC